MGVENRGHEDTIQCEIDGEMMEVGGVDVFDDNTPDEVICSITEDAIIQERREREEEEREIEMLIESGDFKG